ncbi:MAG: peptidoglycan -binding protein [Rhodospirillaceae bacterium]|jgi:chemotaxis protein MotB|nr:peptidoglycan -binding protein [Rhodospirillaceae bacterium]MBT6089850.1 peptidoglycan -binding protein [Rhodospirillaceae bacterium]
MATLARRTRRTTDIWPGFVDALATLLILIIFILMVFVLGQFFLGQALSGRDAALERLTSQVNELGEMLALERQANTDLTLNVSQLSDQLQAANVELDDLASLRMENRELLGQIETRDDEARARDAELARMQTAINAAVEAAEANQAQITEQRQRLALLAQNVRALEALKTELETEISRLGDTVVEREREVATERRVSVEARAQAALMSQQLESLRQELARLAETLDASDALSIEQRAQIADLGRRMNRALAGKVQELQRYRSEFFGRLKDILGTRPGIRVAGDRFVFQSEVLFASGSADLGTEGQRQLTQLAKTLIDIARDIPDEVDWIMRVDGHTDDLPIRTATFRSNWELSIARALSVVRFLIAQGVAPERLAAAGFGEYQPIDPAKTVLARGKNRRIELKLDQR